MTLNQPVPELPVLDVKKAQEYYRDYFGCKIEWTDPSGVIGAVSHGNAAVFFRQRVPPFEPAVHWIYCDAVNEAYSELVAAGANIVEELAEKSWGMRQFTVHDLDGNVFYFHHG